MTSRHFLHSAMKNSKGWKKEELRAAGLNDVNVCGDSMILHEETMVRPRP